MVVNDSGDDDGMGVSGRGCGEEVRVVDRGGVVVAVWVLALVGMCGAEVMGESNDGSGSSDSGEVAHGIMLPSRGPRQTYEASPRARCSPGSSSA